MTRKAIIRLTNSALAITLVLITSCKKEETDPITQPAPSPTPITTASGAGVTDFDGNTYTTIVLGNGQEWMAENLRTTTYTNGDPVENILDPTNWQNATTGAWSHYDNDNQFENPYGKLYNWYAVDDNRNICPTDWHVPTAAEWDVLRTYLDPNGTMMDNVAGSKMKTTGNDYWLYGNTDATNQIGFSGLPGGLHFGNSTDMGELGYWWTATETDATTGELRYLAGTYTELLTYMEQKFIGMNLTGIVTNVTNFGAFVNIGIKENGLIHKSNLAEVYVEDPSDFIALHEHVSVQVMEVDLARKRIGLKRLV